MKRSAMIQYLGVMIALASIFLPSLDMTRVGMLIGIFGFWVGVAMERSKNGDYGQ